MSNLDSDPTSNEILERMMRSFAITVLRERLEQAPDEPHSACDEPHSACDEPVAAPIENSRGAICAQWKRCGRANCRCAQGELHGPYYYRFYREGGRLKKQYLSTKCPDNQRLIEEALAERASRAEYRQHLRQNAQWRAEMREARQLLNEMGRGARFGECTLAQAKERLRRKREKRSKRTAQRASQ